MEKGYFGNYRFINMLISKMIFGALNFRRWTLIRSYSKNRAHIVQLHNGPDTKENMAFFLKKGFTKINIGGGDKNLDGFVNIDFQQHNNVKRELVANFLDLSFIPDESLTHIHSCHAIEHIHHKDLIKQIKEYHRILQLNGIVSIRCPNALGVSYGFFFGQVQETDHEDFLKCGYPEDEDFYNPNDGWYCRDLWGLYHWWYGYNGSVTNEHFNLITPSKIQELLECEGFEIQKMTKPETSNIVVIARKL